ncbi:PilZ domain-containing protein [Marinobacter sp. BGYM27]|uniref:PilZ domain-containing protein n=1 Tax=unclassified Marinobacter TaxID=83889 RepID=UPI0021A37FAE|nr:PilZ domain-containing protein [Marinobacter sp. BGYM27]MDG5498128.1 PilZ domain-containing protein [Marinobacter sp. BGYM27]|tara:strand:- start:68735 stop:69304 length:570 start_codon:yes stop_codon:yes gene_type:complete
MWKGDERRRFYRVDDRVALRFMRLRDNNAVSAEIAKLSLDTRIEEVDAALMQAISALAAQSPEGGRVAELFNRKLALVLESQTASSVNRQATLVTRDINLSAGGLAFSTDEPVELGDSLLLDVLFYPESRTIRALARVVAAEPQNDGYRLRLDFERLTDNDRELLTGHIMRLQSRQLRRRDQSAQSENG